MSTLSSGIDFPLCKFIAFLLLCMCMCARVYAYLAKLEQWISLFYIILHDIPVRQGLSLNLELAAVWGEADVP